MLTEDHSAARYLSRRRTWASRRTRSLRRRGLFQQRSVVAAMDYYGWAVRAGGEEPGGLDDAASSVGRDGWADSSW